MASMAVEGFDNGETRLIFLGAPFSAAQIDIKGRSRK
jgi:hypothetical protein